MVFALTATNLGVMQLWNFTAIKHSLSDASIIVTDEGQLAIGLTFVASNLQPFGQILLFEPPDSRRHKMNAKV